MSRGIRQRQHSPRARRAGHPRLLPPRLRLEAEAPTERRKAGVRGAREPPVRSPASLGLSSQPARAQARLLPPDGRPHRRGLVLVSRRVSAERLAQPIGRLGGSSMPCRPLRKCRPQAAHSGCCRGFHVRLQLLTRQRMRVQMQTGPGSVVGCGTALQRCFALQRSPGSTTAFKDTIRRTESSTRAHGIDGTRLRHEANPGQGVTAVGEPSEKFDNVTASLEVLDVEDHPRRGNRPGRDGSPANGPLSIRHSPDARVCSLSTPTPFTLSRSVALSLVVRVERLTAGCFSRPRAPLHHGAHHGAPHAPNGTLTARVPPLTMKVPTSLPDASISSFRCETKTVWPAARARTCSASARTL